MATQQTTIGTFDVTIIPLAGGGNIVRGLRVTKNTDGTVSAAAANVRGDYVTTSILEDSATYPSQPGTGVPLQQGGIVPMLSLEANATIGATAYTDNAGATGKVDTANTSGVIVGKYNQTCAAGDIVEILLENPL